MAPSAAISPVSEAVGDSVRSSVLADQEAAPQGSVNPFVNDAAPVPEKFSESGNAFALRAKNGRMLIWMRAQNSVGYSAGRFLNRHGEGSRTSPSGHLDMPISVVRATSVSGQFKRDTVIESLQRLCDAKFGPSLYAELTHRQTGAGGALPSNPAP